MMRCRHEYRELSRWIHGVLPTFYCIKCLELFKRKTPVEIEDVLEIPEK